MAMTLAITVMVITAVIAINNRTSHYPHSACLSWYACNDPVKAELKHQLSLPSLPHD